jgi:hypothetical protein
MTTYLHVLFRRRPGVKRYIHRLQRFIRESYERYQYTYQLYRDDNLLRVTVICDPRETDWPLRDMGHAMYKRRLLDDWERVTSVLSEDPTEVPVEALDMVEPEPEP